MPNWCENQVTISNENKKEITILAKECRKKYPRLFNLILPEPDWMKTPNHNGEVPVRKKRGPFKVREFPDGSVDERWYNWCCENWGTKWEISKFLEHSFDIKKDYYGYYLDLSFWTAWSPPIPIYKELHSRGYDVYARYIEGGYSYVGEFVNGKSEEYSFNDKNIPDKFQHRINKLYEEWDKE